MPVAFIPLRGSMIVSANRLLGLTDVPRPYKQEKNKIQNLSRPLA